MADTERAGTVELWRGSWGIVRSEGQDWYFHQQEAAELLEKGIPRSGQSVLFKAGVDNRSRVQAVTLRPHDGEPIPAGRGVGVVSDVYESSCTVELDGGGRATLHFQDLSGSATPVAGDCVEG